MSLSPSAASRGRRDEPTRRPDVELSLPSDGAHLSVLRTTAAALGARLDLTLDEVEDLRMAVDEAAALLLQQSPPEAALHFSFRLEGSSLHVRCEVATDDPRPPSQAGFAWTVLTALARSVEVSLTTTDGRRGLALDLVHGHEHGHVHEPEGAADA